MSKGTVRRLQTAARWLGGRRAAAATALVAALAGLSLWTDQPGLWARYTSHFDQRPVLERTDGWLAVDFDFASSIFPYRRFFRVEWRGWIDVAAPGEHRFRIDSTGPARLLIDGEEVVSGGVERRRKSGRRHLEAGPHRLEMSFDQAGQEVSFAIEMRPPGGEWGEIPPRWLYARSPGAVRRWARRATAGASSVGRRFAATLLLIAALLAAARASRGAPEPTSRPSRLPRLTAWARRPERRRPLAAAALGSLFVVALLAMLPRTGSPFGWDDVRYLDIAAFDKSVPWVINRYAHVYLLDFFIWIARGDAFFGARLFWSAQFAAVVCALAVCAAQLGPRLQLSTFWLSLLLLFSQPLYFLRAGGAVPDTTVGTLVLAAVALSLHRWRRGPPTGRRLEWQILLIGALTVWAVKSKELGVILIWLVVLFAFERGRLDWRGGLRKLGFWLAGAGAGLMLLMACDAVYFGDPIYGLRPAHQREVGDFNLAEDPQQEREAEGWMDVVGQGKTPVASNDPGMRIVGLLVVAAALLAGWRRRSIELRLLHLLPLVYLMMLMVIHVRATYIFLPRYLYPVMPVSAFLAAAGFHYLGVDKLSWRQARSPSFFVPALLLAFLLLAVVAPYRGGWIAAGEFLPAAWLRSIDWSSLDAFVRLVAAPLLVLSLVALLAVFLRHRPTRLLLTATLVALFLTVPFTRTLWELRTRRAWQHAEAILHAWRVLGHELPQEPGAWIEIYLRPTGRERVFGPKATCERIAKVYLRRRDQRITCWPYLSAEQDAAILPDRDYRGWLEGWPALERTAVFSPAGELVLVRPRQAGPPPAAADD